MRPGPQEVKWLTTLLKDKLRNRELDAGVKSDMQTLLSVLQDPVFGKIVTIEVCFSHLRFAYVHACVPSDCSDL